jgi:CDP-diacylglycerol--glycerol-3-phosphate 3-phosphatidyltransferase
MDPVVEKENKRPLTFTDQLRLRFKGRLDPVAGFFNRIGLHPNTMTLLGFVGNVIGAYFLFRGQFAIGGIIILLMGPVDALDGTMARLRGDDGAFGAFVDSVTDRYSELILLGALVLFYTNQGNILGVALSYLAAAGSVLVSYTRARAQSLGKETKIGILTRVERYLVMAPSIILAFINPVIPLVGLGILAVFSNITAIQRIYDVRAQFRG